MLEENTCLRVCSRGLYSCNWRKPSDNRRKCSCCWFSFVTVATLLSVCWMYFCLVSFNDRDDVNSKAFTWFKRWVNWFMVMTIISAVLTSYCVLLLIFALIQLALREQLDLHWLHKIFLSLGLIVITLVAVGLSLKWKDEWPTLPLSLQATGPFLQFGAVGALTLLSPLVFQIFHTNKGVSRVVTAVVFLAASAAIFLCPLCIQSPCLVEMADLPDKPKLIGHRGAPMLAPENTMMSFKRSIECGVAAFETDVQISKDGTPFLLHDNEREFLLRTTNVKQVFPNQTFNRSAELTFKELERLNAGEWFLKADPFQTVSQLSEEEKERARNQTIPSLLQLLKLTEEHNMSIIFDIKSPDVNNDTVNTILNSGIDPSRVLWLPPAEREYAMRAAPKFIQVYGNKTEMLANGGRHLNVKYNSLSKEEISRLRSENVTVNLWVVNQRWLFSLVWCAGASSVTTNSCHLLKDVQRPDWVLSPSAYRMIWISVDIASILIMIAVFAIQRKTHCCHFSEEWSRDRNSAQNEREVLPLR